MPSVDEHLTIAPAFVVDAVHKEASRLTCPFKVYVKKSKYALSFVPIAKSITSFEGFHSYCVVLHQITFAFLVLVPLYI